MGHGKTLPIPYLGKTYATCRNEPGNPKEQRLLLGCGMRHPVKKEEGPLGNWPYATFFVKNATHCECWDATSSQYECYAICGNIREEQEEELRCTLSTGLVRVTVWRLGGAVFVSARLHVVIFGRWPCRGDRA